LYKRQQQRRLVNDQRCPSLRQFPQAFLSESGDSWMGDPVKRLTRPVIGEDLLSQGLAVERAIGQQDLSAEPVDQLAQGLRTWANRFAGEIVGADYKRPEGPERLGHQAFARGYATGKAKNQTTSAGHILLSHRTSSSLAVSAQG
jgi:hypothetical protein